ncbi:MAG: hypothetical protein ACLQMF_13195 [Rectinemataceae bacterium]
MSLFIQLLFVTAFEVAGFFALWFLLRARIRRFLELDNLLEGVRDEARALVIELNESADRSVSLVEDRMKALRELEGEIDKRMGLARHELEKRAMEREVYTKLAQRRPIVPRAGEPSAPTASQESRLDVESASSSSGPASERGGPVPLPLDPRRGPELRVSDEVLASKPNKRDEALDFYRKGFSADIIAVRLGMTVAEIELLVEIEERRSGA